MHRALTFDLRNTADQLLVTSVTQTWNFARGALLAGAVDNADLFALDGTSRT